jgi:2',3'-cyclic-nucleotide 2'-phosphodiesterase (5'-nucleotidase family)
LLKTPVKRNKTIICQAGSKGKFLGTLNLKIDLSGDSIVDFNGRDVFTINSGIIPDPVIQAKVNELEGLVASSMNEVIGELLSNWTRSSRGECNLGNWQTDAIREFTNADIAFQNNGGIRKDLQAGKITIRDIWECNPFGNSLVTFKVRGDSLKMLFEHQVNDAQEKMQVSGLKYSYDPKKPDGSKIVDLKINGKPLENSKYYIIGTNNYIAAQSVKFFGFNINPLLIYNTGLIDREVFIEAVRMQKRIDSKIEGRIVRIE